MNSISEIFIRRPVATTLATVVLVVFGAAAYFKLPVNSLPTVDYPVLQVSAFYPGASPETMASTVATPLENEFTQINGLESVMSQNTEGQTMITLTFSPDRTVDLMAPDVQAAISRAQANLPTDLPTPPFYQKFNPAEQPIMYVALVSPTLTHGELYDYANQILVRRISTLEGVSRVQVFGSKRAVRIQVDPEKLAARELGLAEVVQALRLGTVSVPGGSLNGRYRTFTIDPKGQLQKGADYAKLIIGQKNGAPIRLGEVALCVDSLRNDLVNIRHSFQDPATAVDKCAVLAISRAPGVNTVAVADRVLKAVDTLSKDLPKSISLRLLHNGAEPIRESIRDVQETILIALGLVILVIFLFLGRVRETLIPSVVIPIAILGTFAIMVPFRFSIDTLSLLAIVLAVGFLVDDAIVVLENTVRHVDEGMKPLNAAFRSMREISNTVISTSAVLVVVFIPMVLMTGIVGRNFREFALTVIFAIVISTILALTLTPMMCAVILKHHTAKEEQSIFQRIIHATVGGMIRGYGWILHGMLKARFLSVLGWLFCLVGSVALFFIIPKTFLPEGDSSFLMGALISPQGVSSEQMSGFQKNVESAALQHPGVYSAGSVTGFMPGADQSMGFCFIKLDPPKTRKPIAQVGQELTGRLMMADPTGMAFLAPVPVLKISSGGDTGARGSKYSYILSGLDRGKVQQAALRLEGALRDPANNVPVFGVQSSVKLTMPKLDLRLDRDRASSLGITAAAIENTLAAAYAGGRAATFYTDNDQYDVVVEVDKSKLRAPEDLGSLRIRSPLTGQLVPLSSVATWNEVAGPKEIQHHQQQESATISFNAPPGVPLGVITAMVEKTAASVTEPGVKGEFAGEAREFQKSIKSLGILLVIAIFLMYIILGILYESYVHPFTILTTLPVAAFGGLATLFIFNKLMPGSEIVLSLYAYIGMFMLLGLIAKNGIMMVDFAEQRKAEGKSGFDAIHEACLIRFRPILMTGLCAILGALPLALGYGADAASRVPLGLVVVGGMIFAQVVTLFVTPGIYLYADSCRMWFRRIRPLPEE